MDWVKQLNEAVGYIEENLTGEISYEAMARMAGCSVYNFQRLFSYIADRPLSEYIRWRRLTMAAFELLNGGERIIDIALKYGYESQDAFSRAFRAFHGVLPSAVRNETVQLKSCPKLSFQITIKGETFMNYQIEQWPGFTVMGVARQVKTAEAFAVVPGLWEEAFKDGTIARFMENYPDCRPAGFLGIAQGGQWGDCAEMTYIMAVTNHVDAPGCKHTPAPVSMEEFAYPAATWAIFEANGELPGAIQQVYKEFYTQWLPNSGYGLDDLPVIECYMQDNCQEVWTGIEYQVASHLLSKGFLAEGLDIVRTCRNRYDGTTRNPFNEYECGSWYARAMASYSLLWAYTGVRYDALTKTLYYSLRNSSEYTVFLSTETGYGTVTVKDHHVSLRVLRGEIHVARTEETA